MNDRERLVAPCGIDCGICEMHMAGENPKIMAVMVAKGFAREKLPCAGCRNIAGNCPVLPASCATYTCAGGRGVEFCVECADYPCAMLNPAADRADVLPHNTKLFNLGVIKRDGVSGFIAVSADVKARYFKGKMAVGKGPQLPPA
jgi:hypothetical protein